MLGIIGFIAAAAVIGAFVWSASRAYTTISPIRLQAFNTAFVLLAAAMIGWALIIVMDTSQITRNFMLVSDILLLIGTACMVVVMVGRLSLSMIASLSAGVALLAAYRAYVQPPTAFVRDGLLYFNLQGSSRLFVVGLFALVWLPALMFLAGRIADDPLLTRWRYSLQMYFVTLVALLAMFTKARRSIVIIALFFAIVLVFGLMTALNRTLAQAHLAVKQVPEKRPAHKRKEVRHAAV